MNAKKLQTIFTEVIKTIWVGAKVSLQLCHYFIKIKNIGFHNREFLHN